MDADRARRPTIVITAAVVVAVVALVVTAWLGGDEATGGRRTPPEAQAVVPPTATVREVVSSLVVLRDWDRARAAAWGAGDTAALDDLYDPASRAGRRDVAMLRQWVDRGIRVRRMSMQVLDVQLRVRTDRRIVLVVTDRLAGPVAVADDGRRWRLPRDGMTTRRLEFRRTADHWLLVSVHDRPAGTLTSRS